MTELNKLSIIDALASLQSREFTATELTKAHLDAIKKYKNLNSFILTLEQQAMDAAAKADENYQNKKAGPLEGIPIGMKDLFCTKNIRTTSCSKMLENFVPPYESTVSHNLKAAGTIMLGKLNMDEFAMGSDNTTSYFGNAISPWKKNNSDAAITPGGSSGGSAASVASFTSMASTGSDTGGSIRQPAAFTGIVGIKPTYGRCSRWGMISFASSLDQAGIFARSCADAAIVLESMMGYDPKDSTSINAEVPQLRGAYSQDVKNMKIGVPRNLMELEGVSQEIIKMWENTIDIYKQQGAEIIDIDLHYAKYALPVYYVIAPAEASSNLARYDGIRYGHRTSNNNLSLEELYILSRTEGFGAEVKRRIMIGTYVLSSSQMDAYYIKAQRVRRLIYNDFKEAHKKCEVILLPSTPSAAFEIGENSSDPLQMYLNDIFTIPASLAGLPCMSVPAAVNSDGLPLGMQLVGKQLDEYSIIRAGSALEKATNINFTPKGY